jgi:SAM-dependent methyltransferase
MKILMFLRKRLRIVAVVSYRWILGVVGINPLSVGMGIRVLPKYIRDILKYTSAYSAGDSFKIHFHHLHPCLSDLNADAGVAKGDYFHQDLWMAKKIFENQPEKHWDIGSRFDGFIAHLLSFRSVNVIDIRKFESNIPGLTFHQGDVTNLKFPDETISSLSCLHAMEHVGLGRYGDPIDPIGYLKGINELQRVLAPNGMLYFSVPIGVERVEFNAQRVFNPKTIIQAFSDLELIDFAAINESGDFVYPSNYNDFIDARRACGLFIFQKN